MRFKPSEKDIRSGPAELPRALLGMWAETRIVISQPNQSVEMRICDTIADQHLCMACIFSP
jgi:hypothetical protein